MKLPKKLADEIVNAYGRHVTDPAKAEVNRKLAKSQKRQGRDQAFDALCEAHGLPAPVSEYEFAKDIGRKWRFDHCWPDYDVALEVQGGLFVGGRHARGAALLDEHEKLNAAAAHGWRVVFCAPRDISSGRVFAWLRAAFEESPECFAKEGS